VDIKAGVKFHGFYYLVEPHSGAALLKFKLSAILQLRCTVVRLYEFKPAHILLMYRISALHPVRTVEWCMLQPWREQ